MNTSYGIIDRSNLIQEVQHISVEDQLLLTKVRDGNEEAFGELYAKYKHSIYLFCMRMIGDTMTAEDIFQDVFIRCYENIRSGTEITFIKSYLFTSARNRCLNVIRSQKKLFELEDAEDIVRHEQFEEYDVAENIQGALESIPPLNREAFLLCEYEGYTYQEAAQLTDVPVSTVRKRIFRARQRLRKLLEEK